MLSTVVFVVTLLVVGALLFLAGSLLLGRGEAAPPADADRSPLELPADRPVHADDVRAVRMTVTVRGYRMTEVDWLLEQLAQTIEQRDEQIAALVEQRDEQLGAPVEQRDEQLGAPIEQRADRGGGPAPEGAGPPGAPAPERTPDA